MRKISIYLAVLFVVLIGGAPHLSAQTAIINSPSPLPTILCIGDSINFVADNNSGTLTTYEWNFNGAASGPNTIYGQNVWFYAGAVGTYSMRLIVGNGTLLDTLNFPMTVSSCSTPTIDISGTPTTVCAGTQTQFVDASIPGAQPISGRLWKFPGGAPAASSVANPIITYTTAGIYDVYFELTDASGAKFYDTLFSYITVVNCPTPIADFSANQTRICPGSCINFTDLSQNMVVGQSNWAWSFPGADSTVSIQQNPVNICYQIPGVYTVILKATNSTDTDTEVKLNYITVDSCLPPVANFSVEKDKICQGTCVRYLNRSQRADSIRWKFFGATTRPTNSTESNPVVCYTDTGTFDVQLMAFNPYGGPGIELKQEFISVKPFPVVQAPADTSVLIGQGVQLQAYGSGRGFRWTPSDGSIACEFCSRTTVSPLENTQYFVTNINENGCERTDSVNVVVIKNYYRGVPDAFTPNGDEENDILFVLGNGIAGMEFYVYDRQGTIVFESRSQEIGWDGTFQGEVMEAGVYAYFVKITYESGFQEILKGDVTLVR